MSLWKTSSLQLHRNSLWALFISRWEKSFQLHSWYSFSNWWKKDSELQCIVDFSLFSTAKLSNSCDVLEKEGRQAIPPQRVWVNDCLGDGVITGRTLDKTNRCHYCCLAGASVAMHLFKSSHLTLRNVDMCKSVAHSVWIYAKMVTRPSFMCFVLNLHVCWAGCSSCERALHTVVRTH